MMIIRKKLTPDEISNPNLRYNPDCDCVQQTSDGGATWFDQPGQDPRSSPAFAVPPVSSSDPACDAAASIIANFRDGLTQTLLSISGGANAFGAASVLLTILSFLSGIGLLIQLIIDFCSVLISIGVTGVEAAFTDDVYDQLECILFCDIGADGSVTPEQFAAIQNDVETAFGALSDVNLVFQGWLAQLGNVGLQNVAALKHTTGDCADCSCGCPFLVTFDSGQPFTIIAFGLGTTAVLATLDTGFGNPAPSILSGFMSNDGSGEPGYALAVELDLGVDSTIVTGSSIDVYFDRNDNTVTYVQIDYLNSAHGSIATWNTTIGPRNVWITEPITLAGSNVRYVQVRVAGSGGIFTSGFANLDNVCINVVG